MAVAADLVAPIAAARVDGFGLEVHSLPVEGPGWREAGAAAEDPELLEALLQRICAANDSPMRNVAATWLVELHGWYTISATVAALMVHGRMPPLDATLVHDSEAGWPDAVALPADGWEPADGERLSRELEAHFVPLIEALSRIRSRKALWRALGDRLGQAVLWCGEAFSAREQAWALGEAAYAADTALQAPAGFRIAEDGQPSRARFGCCLSFRLPAAIICPECRIAKR